MSAYRDTYDRHGRLVIDWKRDLAQRYVFLYGNAYDRLQSQAADMKAWRDLGRKK